MRWFVCCFVTLSWSQAIHSTELHNVALDGPYYAMKGVRNAHQCYNLCVSHTACKSFNYNIVSKRCELFERTSASLSLNSKQNSVYVEIPPDALTRGPSTCNKRPCQQNEVCITTEKKGYICTKAAVDCGTPKRICGAAVTYTATGFQSTATYTCATGYVYVTGSNTSECQAGGEWSDTKLNCAGVDCGIPRAVLNANVTYTSTTFPSLATYTCTTGYVYTTGSNATSCQTNGLWSTPTLHCTVIDCGIPPDVVGISVRYTATTYQSVAELSCRAGYNYTGGSNTSTCQPSGQWSDPVLNCTSTTTCPSPPALANASVTYNSTSLYGVASYSCVTDHKFFGRSDQSTCSAAQTWTGLSGTCERVYFYDILLPFHGSIPGTVEDGWTLEMIGTPLNEDRMTFELRYGTVYKAVQLDVRFSYGTFVNVVNRNTLTDQGWGPEESTQPYFPFKIGQEFNLTIVVTLLEFDIYVNQKYFLSRSHHVNPSLIDEVVLLRGVSMESVKLFYKPPAPNVFTI